MIKIECTTDYSLFKFYAFNRPISTNSNLKKGIEELDLTQYEPILVDSHFYIIDGQHRFTTCKELGKPIYYIKLPDSINSKKAMMVLNQYQKMWRQEEYLHFHAIENGGCYKELELFEERYRLGVSNTMIIYPDRAINAKTIRMGTVQFGKNPFAENIVEFLNSEEVRNLRFRKTRPFVLAVKKAFEIYSLKQMNKLRRKIVFIQMCANYEQYLTAFANLIK